MEVEASASASAGPAVAGSVSKPKSRQNSSRGWLFTVLSAVPIAVASSSCPLVSGVEEEEEEEVAQEAPPSANTARATSMVLTAAGPTSHVLLSGACRVGKHSRSSDESTSRRVSRRGRGIGPAHSTLRLG